MLTARLASRPLAASRHLSLSRIAWWLLWTVIVLTVPLLLVLIQNERIGSGVALWLQMERTGAIVTGTQLAPFQHRVLSEFAVAGLVFAFDQPLVAFLTTRLLQNTAILVLALGYWRSLGMRREVRLLATAMLVWSMSEVFRAADWGFNTYTDIAFYLAAAWAITTRRDRFIGPLTLLAALNRETAIFIPVMLLVARAFESRAALRQALPFVLGASAAYVVVFVGLRMVYQPTGWWLVGDIGPGLDLVLYNLRSPATAVNLLITLSLIPALALVRWRYAPPVLSAFGWALLPGWCLLMLVFGVMAETRLFLVPMLVVFIPMALAGVNFSSNHAR